MNADDAPELQQYVSEMYKGKLKVSFEIFKGRIGTAEALLRVKDKIKVTCACLILIFRAITSL